MMPRGCHGRRFDFGTALVLAVCAQAHVAAACEGSSVERIVGYSVGSDRYAIRSQPSAAEPERSRFLIRRLSTGEPIDNVDCAKSGPCELTAVLGMRGCSFASVAPGRTLYGLELAPVGGGGSPLWTLSLEGKGGRVPVLAVRADAPLELRTAARMGRHVVVVVSETFGGSCVRVTDHVLVLDDSELRTLRSEGAKVSAEAGPREISLHEADRDSVPIPRTSRPFRPMRARTVAKAARAAAAAGMVRLASCWIAHNVAVMTPRARLALAHALREDPILSPFAPLALRHRHRHG
jgi:hypothetical protein